MDDSKLCQSYWCSALKTSVSDAGELRLKIEHWRKGEMAVDGSGVSWKAWLCFLLSTASLVQRRHHNKVSLKSPIAHSFSLRALEDWLSPCTAPYNTSTNSHCSFRLGDTKVTTLQYIQDAFLLQCEGTQLELWYPGNHNNTWLLIWHLQNYKRPKDLYMILHWL